MINSEKNTHIAVKGIIIKGDKFLAIKRSAYCVTEVDEWDLPGGRLEFGETPEEALIREIREEVGKNDYEKWAFSEGLIRDLRKFNWQY